jgi:hypothetical protein
MYKITSAEVIKSGTGKSGNTWTLVKIALEGQNGTFTGFVYEKVPLAGQELDLELYQEEYNGKMQDKFRFSGSKKASPQSPVNEMAIKMEVARYGAEILRKLDLIIKHFEIIDIQQNIKDRANEEPKVPTWDQEEEVNPEDIPF